MNKAPVFGIYITKYWYLYKVNYIIVMWKNNTPVFDFFPHRYNLNIQYV